MEVAAKQVNIEHIGRGSQPDRQHQLIEGAPETRDGLQGKLLIQRELKQKDDTLRLTIRILLVCKEKKCNRQLKQRCTGKVNTLYWPR